MKKHKDIEQGSREWLFKRRGKITGTVLKSIMGTPKAKQDAIYEMVASRLTTLDVEDDENPMERGTRLEPDAIAEFELETGKTVERIGFAEDDTNPLIANSPDGLIGDTEAVEAKCPGGKNHVKWWLENKLPEEYVWQVMQYFVVNEKLQTLYFVSYNPDIEIHPLHIIEVKREQILTNIDKAKAAQDVFLKEVETILSTIIEEL